jgi:hypothetical protein
MSRTISPSRLLAIRGENNFPQLINRDIRDSGGPPLDTFFKVAFVEPIVEYGPSLPVGEWSYLRREKIEEPNGFGIFSFDALPRVLFGKHDSPRQFFGRTHFSFSPSRRFISATKVLTRL